MADILFHSFQICTVLEQPPVGARGPEMTSQAQLVLTCRDRSSQPLQCLIPVPGPLPLVNLVKPRGDGHVGGCRRVRPLRFFCHPRSRQMAPSVPPAQTDGQNLPAGCCKGSQKLPDGVIASIIVVIESELKLRQLIEMGEKLHLAYSVGRAPSDQQSVIKQEVIDLTYEPELEERPAEAHISQSLPGPSQINTAMNVGQPSLLSTLPFLQNKQFYYDGSSPYGNLPFFPMTDNVNPYSFGFRPRSTLAASAGNAGFPSSQNSNGGFNVGPSASPCLAPNFDGQQQLLQSPFTAEVWNREESEGEEDERIRSTEDEYEVHRRRRSKKRIRGHCENGVFRDSQLSFRLEQGRVRHACQEIGCRSSLGQGYVLQHVRLHCKRMPHVSPQDMAERCFPRIAWTWLS